MFIRGTNLHTSVFVWLVKLQFDDVRKRTKEDFVVPAPEAGMRTRRLAEMGGVEVGTGDFEDDGIHTPERLLIRLLNWITPLSDPIDPYASIDEAQTELAEEFGTRLRTVTGWPEPTTDAMLTTLALQGLAAHRLERTDGGYHVDLSGMESLAVRDGFARYGARLCFDDAMTPVAIERLGERHTPGSPGWEVAKLAFRSALAVSATVRDHAVHCHFTAANAFTIATRRNLPPDHPLRLLLHPFQYRTPTINSGAMLTLLPKRAIFHRLFGFEWESLQQLYRDSLASFRLETLPEDLARRGVEDLAEFPYAEDGLAFHAILERLCVDYLDAVALPDSPAEDEHVRAFRDDLDALLPDGVSVGELADRAGLARACAYFMFQATAFHEQVGGAIGDYLSRPDMVVPALRDGDTPVDMWPSRNTMVQSVMLGVLTNFDVPQVTMDFAEWVPEAARPVVERFQREIDEHQRAVEARNADRAVELHTFEPAYLEISVSI